MRQEIIHIMPIRLRNNVEHVLKERRDTEEIRVRIGQPLEIRCKDNSIWLEEVVSTEDMEEMLTFISKYSIYAYEEEIRQGFLTIEGGNRIGFAGQVRLEKGQVHNMANIRFLNIRIAKEQKDCAKDLIPWIVKDGEVLNTLLISKPGIGKTTYLRDCIRMISNGDAKRRGNKVCIIDERSEIAASHLGIPQNDVGRCTDVLDGCPKKIGMRMALRSMSPEVLAVDELGGVEDAVEIEQMVLCGCKIIGTMHGDHIKHIIQVEGIKELHQKRLFERYVFLRKDIKGERTFEIYNQECERIC